MHRSDQRRKVSSKERRESHVLAIARYKEQNRKGVSPKNGFNSESWAKKNSGKIITEQDDQQRPMYHEDTGTGWRAAITGWKKALETKSEQAESEIDMPIDGFHKDFWKVWVRWAGNGIFWDAWSEKTVWKNTALMRRYPQIPNRCSLRKKGRKKTAEPEWKILTRILCEK